MPTEIISFIAGIFVGAMAVVIVWYNIVSNNIKKRQAAFKDELEKITADYYKQSGDDADKAEARLSKVREITQEQLELGQGLGRPQKNALDGKYQNMISRQISSLEEEKQVILRSILADGLDPVVGIQKEDGSIERIKLSEYMAQSGPPSKPPTADELKQERIKKLNLSLIKGGKSNGEDSGSTTH